MMARDLLFHGCGPEGASFLLPRAARAATRPTRQRIPRVRDMSLHFTVGGGQ